MYRLIYLTTGETYKTFDAELLQVTLDKQTYLKTREIMVICIVSYYSMSYQYKHDDFDTHRNSIEELIFDCEFYKE